MQVRDLCLRSLNDRGLLHPVSPQPNGLSTMTRRLFIIGLSLALGLPASRAEEKPAVDPYDPSMVPLEVEPPADFKGKKIVLVAGKQSHGPGDHEFFAGAAILMNLLKQTDGVWPVMARDGWPKNEKIFDGAASIL